MSGKKGQEKKNADVCDIVFLTFWHGKNKYSIEPMLKSGPDKKYLAMHTDSIFEIFEYWNILYSVSQEN